MISSVWCMLSNYFLHPPTVTGVGTRRQKQQTLLLAWKSVEFVSHIFVLSINIGKIFRGKTSIECRPDVSSVTTWERKIYRQTFATVRYAVSTKPDRNVTRISKFSPIQHSWRFPNEVKKRNANVWLHSLNMFHNSLKYCWWHLHNFMRDNSMSGWLESSSWHAQEEN